MRTYHWIFTSLGLVGLYGCDDAGLPPAEAPAPRNAIYLGPPETVCLTDTKVTLFHDDKTQDSAQDIGEGLALYARPNDEVEVQFSVPTACSEKFGSRVSLTSYTAPGIIKYGMKPGAPSHAHDMHTTRASDQKSHVLRVRLPNCFFRVDLAFGEPLAVLGGAGVGDPVIASTQGGSSTCEGLSRHEIAAFDTVERGWGDAPLLRHLGWDVNIVGGFDQKYPPLKCEIDFEGDGKVDQVLSPCTSDTSSMKLAALPVHSFAQPGEHQPEIVVSRGTRRMWARTTVLANKLAYKPDVLFPEKYPGFVGGSLTPAPAPALSKLTLQFTKQTPSVEVGQVVVGTGVAGGYMLRVSQVAKLGSTLTLSGTVVGLDETIAGGYFGVRDIVLPTTAMKCRTPPCLGTLTTIGAPPGLLAAKPTPLAIDAPKLSLTDEEHTYGFKIIVPLSDSGQGVGSEAELLGGIVVKKFAVDGLIFGELTVDIDITPTLETGVLVKAEIEEEFELGEWWIGALPTPVPVTITLTPKVKLSSAFEFAGKFKMEVPFQLARGPQGWDHRFAPDISGDAYLLDAGTEIEATLESKFSLVPEIGLSVGPIDGPYVAPVGSLGIKASANFDTCDFCMTVFAELGGEIGWDAPWGLSEFFDEIEIVIGEFELKKSCKAMSTCEPPDPGGGGGGGGGGGSWGDVHVISHDGLLFDFQAGGEFVLARATAGVPFEVQARQEPLGEQLSLSYNTAIATKVGSENIGVYAGQPLPLHRNGAFIDLPPGASIQPSGGGSVAREADGLYTFTYPSGETMRVRPVGAGIHAHLDVGITLPPGRANQMEGLLGDADSVTANDIGLGGDSYVPQPVSFDQLYRGADSFTTKWRVAQSLFHYEPGTNADTYRALAFTQMPLSTPPSSPDLALAAIACEPCPDLLRDTCMLDVGFTGDVAFAAACQDAPGVPGAVLVPDDFVAVSPRHGEPIDCDDPRLVFRGPELANADQVSGGVSLAVTLTGTQDGGWTSDTLETFYNHGIPPGGALDWGAKFECVAIGADGYGECTWRLNPTSGPCVTDSHPYYFWAAFAIGVSDGYYTSAVFTRQ